MIEFACPYCSKILKTKDDKAGLRAACPGCGAEVAVPVAASSPDTVLDVEVVESEAGAEKACPMCGSKIRAAARKCRYCGEVLDGRRSRVAPHRGVTILVLGLVSWFLCAVCGLFGVICGAIAYSMGTHDLKEMDAGRMDDEGRTLTQIGRIVALLQIILSVLMIVVAVVMIVIGELNK